MSGASFNALLQSLDATSTDVDEEGTGEKVLYRANLIVELPADQLAAFTSLVNKQGVMTLAAQAPEGAPVENNPDNDWLNP